MTAPKGAYQLDSEESEPVNNTDGDRTSERFTLRQGESLSFLRVADDRSARMTAPNGSPVAPLDVLHGHDCPYYPPAVCPEKERAQRALDDLADAGYRLVRGPEPWCPECFEAPEPDGPWAAPGDHCADEHVLPWLHRRDRQS